MIKFTFYSSSGKEYEWEIEDWVISTAPMWDDYLEFEEELEKAFGNNNN